MEIRQDSLWSARTSLLNEIETPSLGALGRWLDKKRQAPNSLLQALKLLAHQGDYDAVVTSTLRTGQIFGFARTLFRIRRPVHVHLELWLDDERDSFWWKAKRFFQRLAFASTDLMITSASGEIEVYSERFNLPPDRFRFVPFHTNVVRPGAVGREGGYAFSAGKSGRDYPLLAEAAKDIDVELVVLGNERSLRGVVFPEQAEVLVDQPYDRYLELLHGCDFVVVPLADSEISRGHVVILEAMALGKPVIATKTLATVDYIESGDNGILVPPGDPPSLAAAIRQLSGDPELRAHLSKRGLERMQRHTFRNYVETILAHVEDTVSSA